MAGSGIWQTGHGGVHDISAFLGDGGGHERNYRFQHRLDSDHRPDIYRDSVMDILKRKIQRLAVVRIVCGLFGGLVSDLQR